MHESTIVYLMTLPRMLVAYAVPEDSRKANSWSDGFTKGIEHISDRFDVTWCNVYSRHELRLLEDLRTFDFLLVKSNWDWVVDRIVRKTVRWDETPRGIVISGVAPPPTLRAMRYYDVLYHQTKWYAPQLAGHCNVIHAFGIDSDLMVPSNTTRRDFDWIFIGSLVTHKRPERLLAKAGRRLAVAGPSVDGAIRDRLLADGIRVSDWVSQPELASLLQRSRRALIPCTIDGGGERAVLEARACGLPVEVAADNPKLQELLESPVYNYKYYGDQIALGALSVIGRRHNRATSTWQSWTPSTIKESLKSRLPKS